MGVRGHAAVPETHSAVPKCYCGQCPSLKGSALEWCLAVKVSLSFRELTQEGTVAGGFLPQLHIWAISCGDTWKDKTNLEEKM